MRPALIEQNIALLRQGAELVGRLDDDHYAAVGPHLRHCIDFFHSFLGGLESGRVDYDARERLPELERERRRGWAALESIARALESLDEPGERPLQVRSDASPAEAPEDAWTGSTVGRELRYLVSHTVHHYALVALLLRARGFEPGDDFGVAPSTLAYRGATTPARR